MTTTIQENPIEYMGDGVYIEYDGYGYWLRANHHSSQLCDHEIYLEPSVLINMNNFAKMVASQKDASEGCRNE